MGGEEEEPRPCNSEKEEDEERGPGHGEASGAGAAEGLTPWEQHSAVISIPRFDYRAPAALLERSHSGFLITCPIKREKSATKEVITILEEYIGCMHRNSFEMLGQSDTNGAVKKRKLCLKEIDAGHTESVQRKEATDTASTFDKGSEEATQPRIPSLKSDGNGKTSALSLVKLTKSGLLLFTFTNDAFHAVKTLSDILQSLGSGTLKPPLWCHRIFPIQETCALIEKNLQRVVSKLIQEYLDNEEDKLETPIKFAVGFNRRGINETLVKCTKSTTEDSKGSTLLDRDKCFQVVAGAVKAVAPNSSVDLSSPELAVLVEYLPISGVPHGSPVVGVSVLPSNLIITKPRLSVKSLVQDAKAAKKTG